MSDTLRVLLLAVASDGSEHRCLVPSDRPVPPKGRTDAAFACACGEVFAAKITNLSRATEYTPRCLVRMGVMRDHRVTS